LLLVLIVGGRIRPRTFGKRNGNGDTTGRRERRAAVSDPVTQPVSVQTSEPSRGRFSQWVNRLSWPQRRGAAEAHAYLEPLNGNREDPLNRIPLDAKEITIGRDPAQATVMMDEPSIADLHARLRRIENGQFLIRDEQSQAGTWVNFEPVSAEGTKLQHGDIIHVGRIGLCITYSDANRIPKLKVLHLES
jgi:hypothetical protein